MATYKELLEQQKQLQVQISEVRAREVSDVISRIRQLADEYQLSPYEIFPATRSLTRKTVLTSVVAPKYRDPVSGATWSGRGKPPNWIKGKNREEFLIP